MSGEVESLALGVEKVSLNRSSPRKSFRTPSLKEDTEDAPSWGSYGDVDMHDIPSTSDAVESLTEDVNPQNDQSARQAHIPARATSSTNESTGRYQSSPVSLRREGRSSLGLIWEVIRVIEDLLVPSICFFILHIPAFRATTKTYLGIASKLTIVFVQINQGLNIARLSLSLFNATRPHRGTRKTGFSGKSKRPPRTRTTSSEWALTAVDKVDNFILKVIVWIVFVVARVCVILVCGAFLRFRSGESNRLLGTCIEYVNFFANTALDLGDYQDFLTKQEANVLQECKTVPDLVFEREYMCT